MSQSLNDRLLDHLGTCERKLQEAFKAERSVFQVAIDARDEARAAVLKHMLPADPSAIYHPDSGYSVLWEDREDFD